MSKHGKRFLTAREQVDREREYTPREAIERSCDFEILPTLSRFGSGEPFSSPSASLISTAAGGVLVMNSNERSS